MKNAATDIRWAPLGETGRLVWRRPPLDHAQGREYWGIASSRFPVSSDRWDADRRLHPLLQRVRAVLHAARQRQSGIVTVDGCATARLVDAGARTFGLPILRATIAKSWAVWKKRIGHSAADLIVSPPLRAATESVHGTPPDYVQHVQHVQQLDVLSPADQALLWLADAVFQVYERPRGSWSRLPDRPSHLQRILSHVGPDAEDQWREVLRTPDPRVLRFCARSQTEAASTPLPEAVSPSSAIMRNDSIETDRPRLVHWTRACSGVWPGESETLRAARLLTGHGFGDRSTLGVVKRIIHERSLVASHRCIRSGDSVVCFSAAPLADAAPQYQSHRRRWDREGFGVAIDRQALARLGARPVVYGNDADYERLPAALKPFFQAEGKSSQWRAEQEWRILGDLAFDSLPADAIELLAPNREAAAELSSMSPWPVRVVGADQ